MDPEVKEQLSTPVETKASTPKASDTTGNTQVKRGAYLPEYFVMLSLLAVIVFAVVSLVDTGIRSLVLETQSGSLYAAQYDTNALQLSWSLSALLAALPIFAWLFLRTRNVEAVTPAVRAHRLHKAFLGTFLVSQVFLMVALLGGMVFNLISPFLSGDRGGAIPEYYLLGQTVAESAPWWVTVSSALVGILIVGFVVYVMSDDYRSEAISERHE